MIERRQRGKFLIVVKTYPNPSASLVETVCTAAVDEQGRFVRLYPIPFRSLDEARKFKKWQWIEATVVRSDSDFRPESYKIDTTTIVPLGIMDVGRPGWVERWKHVEHLIQPSMCALDKIKPGPQSPSLALIKPRSWDLVVDDLPLGKREWTAAERSKLMQMDGARDLFGSAPPKRSQLEKLPVKISYRFRCADPKCRGHKKLFEDWEVCQSWRDWQHIYSDRATLVQKLNERYADIPRNFDNLYLFVGTVFSNPTSWVVIGGAQPLHLRRDPANRDAPAADPSYFQASLLPLIDGTS